MNFEILFQNALIIEALSLILTNVQPKHLFFPLPLMLKYFIYIPAEIIF